MTTFSRDANGIDVVNQFKKEAEGKTILITGASESVLGAETAISLAHANPAHLILTARTENKVKPVQDQIAALNPSIKTTFVPIDLSDFDSVRTAASQVNSSISKLDILINNAGVMALPRFEKNKDGIEMQFATNHLGHFLFTSLIFPKILAAGTGSRIVNLTSDGHRIGPWRKDDYNFKNGADYDMWSGYGQGKTANILFTRFLAAKLKSKGIHSFAAHPGVILTTQLSRHVEDPAAFSACTDAAIKNTGRGFEMDKPKTAQQGVATTLRTALDPTITDLTGTYWNHSNQEDTYDYALHMGNAEELWKQSETLVGQKFDL